MVMIAETTWTDREKASLRDLRAAGERAEDISKKIGRSIGAIQKMAKKLGLTPQQGCRSANTPSATDGLRALQVALSLRIVRQAPAAGVRAPLSLPIPSPRTCQWIDGDVKPQPQFCGCATVPGKSWCGPHLRRVYVQYTQQEAA